MRQGCGCVGGVRKAGWMHVCTCDVMYAFMRINNVCTISLPRRPKGLASIASSTDVAYCLRYIYIHTHIYIYIYGGRKSEPASFTQTNENQIGGGIKPENCVSIVDFEIGEFVVLTPNCVQGEAGTGREHINKRRRRLKLVNRCFNSRPCARGSRDGLGFEGKGLVGHLCLVLG